MLHYADTPSTSTNVPVSVRSVHIHSLSTSSGFVSATFSYTVGPLDLSRFTFVQTHLSTGDECSLLLPVQVSPALLAHPVFQDAYECAYLESEAEDKEWSIPKLLNTVYRELEDVVRYAKEPDIYPWTVGFVLGMLTLVAEQDTTLALTGLAHCCFLLPLMTQPRPSDWPRREPYHAFLFHRRAVKAYRACVRVYQAQGKNFFEAQRLALQGRE
jgi:hypothetical protein